MKDGGMSESKAKLTDALNVLLEKYSQANYSDENGPLSRSAKRHNTMVAANLKIAIKDSVASSHVTPVPSPDTSDSE
jgi:molybdenum-dependent DNA-binding transcriptional regulator ModE